MSLAVTARFMRYLALGAIAASVNWSSRFAWSLFAPFEVAVLLAYLTGMVVAFVLFRWLVFSGSENTFSRQVRNFVLVNIAGLMLTLMVAWLLARLVFPAVNFGFHPDAVAHAVAIVAPVLTSWFGHKRFTFASPA
jgi:putative flippase GtrA